MNPSNTIEFVLLHTPTASIRIPIQNWKTLRDARVVKQDLNYSCGAASLATLLNEFYGQSVTEEVLLKAMEKAIYVLHLKICKKPYRDLALRRKALLLIMSN